MKMSSDNYNNEIQAPMKTIVKGSAIVFTGMVFGYVLNLVFKMVVARHYGPAGYGLLSMASAIMVMVGNIGGMGLNIGIARFVGMFHGQGEYEKIQYSVAAGAKVVFLVGIFLSVVVFLLSPTLGRQLGGEENLLFMIYFFSLIIPLFVLLHYCRGVLRGFKDMISMVICNDIVNSITRVLIVVVLVFYGVSIKYIPVAYLCSILMALMLSWLFIKKNYAIFLNHHENNESSDFRFSELILFSLPLALATITNMFRKRFDVLIIGFFLPVSQVGLYSTAMAVAMIPTMFLFSVNRILMPVASELFGQDNDEEMGSVYKTVARWSVIVSLPVFFVNFVYAEIILAALFGSEFSNGGWALRILSIGALANAGSGSFGEYLQAYGKTKEIFLIFVSGTVINIVLMILLIPRFGINGAAAGMSFSILSMCLLGSIFLYKYQSLSPFSNEYFKTLIIGSCILVNLGWVYLLPESLENVFNIGAAIFIVFLIYMLFLVLSGAVNEDDKLLFAAVKKKGMSLIIRL